MDERAGPMDELLKKPSSEGIVGLKVNTISTGSASKAVTAGSGNGINARHDIMYRNISGFGRGYAISGARSGPLSQGPPYSTGGMGIIIDTGTIRCIDQEGGIFLIITGDGDHFLPLNLPEKFEKDGLNVEFKAIKLPINPAYRMYGSPIRIISISLNPAMEGTIETTGTVTWIPLEGGFYGIIADDGTQYDPLNLPKEYAQDGFRIGFKAIEEPNMASIHMWGTIVTITSVRSVSQDGPINKGVLADYKRTGGIAGFNDHLTIFENGTAAVTTKNGGNRYTLSSGEKDDLITLFETSGFNSVNQEDLPMFKVSGNDFFFYLVEFRGHKIEAIEYAFPESIDPVIERLNSLVLQGMA